MTPTVVAVEQLSYIVTIERLATDLASRKADEGRAIRLVKTVN